MGRGFGLRRGATAPRARCRLAHHSLRSWRAMLCPSHATADGPRDGAMQQKGDRDAEQNDTNFHRVMLRLGHHALVTL